MANLYLKSHILEVVENQLRAYDVLKSNEQYNEKRYTERLESIK